MRCSCKAGVTSFIDLNKVNIILVDLIDRIQCSPNRKRIPVNALVHCNTLASTQHETKSHEVPSTPRGH